MAEKSLEELARLVGGKAIGDPSFVVEGISSLDLAGPREITFLVNPRLRHKLETSRAGAVIVPNRDLGDRRPMLEVADPYLAYAQIAGLFNPPDRLFRGVSEDAYIDPQAEIGADVDIAPWVWVGRRAKIGDRAMLYPGVWVGEDCVIGARSVLHPSVVICSRCRLGKGVVVHAGTVIGSDGFGYARDGNRYVKIPQLGIVRIDDDVEIGANNTIDRASFGMTWIQRGVKTDNLVHIGHNVVVGEDSVLIAQVGIAGSAELGKGVVLAGQVGIAGHLHIGDGAMVGPQSGVGKDVPEKGVVSGSPAIAHRIWLRAVNILPRLPDLISRLRALERKVEALEKDSHGR
jgi:UDP-3-O-[3-hydroxymyristoyl] glucosamine N-acyltransferase